MKVWKLIFFKLQNRPVYVLWVVFCFGLLVVVFCFLWDFFVIIVCLFVGFFCFCSFGLVCLLGVFSLFFDCVLFFFF